MPLKQLTEDYKTQIELGQELCEIRRIYLLQASKVVLPNDRYYQKLHDRTSIVDNIMSELAGTKPTVTTT